MTGEWTGGYKRMPDSAASDGLALVLTVFNNMF